MSHTELHLVFVLPTKNESATVADLIKSLKSLAENQKWKSETVVVDDSTDGTKNAAKSAGAAVIDGGGQGLGQAMLRGLAWAKARNPHWIVSLDSDGQVDINEIPTFIAQAESQNADMAISSRFAAPDRFDYVYPRINWAGNRILVLILRLSTGFPFTDSHGGIRLMKPSVLDGLFLIGRHTYVQETLIQIHRSGHKIIELPSRWKERGAGESRVLQSIPRYVVRTLPALLYHLRAHFLLLILAAILLCVDAPTFGALAGIAGAMIWSLPKYALRIEGATRA